MKPIAVCHAPLFFVLCLLLHSGGATMQGADPAAPTAATPTGRNRPDPAAAPAPGTKGPAWLHDMPLVVAGGWDSEPATQRRWNDVTVDYMGDYLRQNSEDTVRKLKRMGVTLVINHYFKGYGIRGEGAYMEDAARFAALCHRHGLRVGAYIGDTLCYEQFLAEHPKAIDWVVPDYLGEPVRYGGTQTFRMRPYVGHPAYRAYVQRVLRKAIVDAKVDFIHFDNSCSYGLPQNFHHPLAIEQFRDFLRTKYTAAQRIDRFDFADMSHLLPPKYRGIPQPIQDPLFQEWTDFRCATSAGYLAEMRRYIKELNPDVAVESNPHGVNGDNAPWTRGIDWPRILGPTEVFWCEGENEPGILDNGALVSRIRTYKTGQTMENLALVQLGHNKLMLAEAMAWNRNCLGYIGARLSVDYWDADAIRNVRFFHAHFPYYRRATGIPEVAILRTFPTMAYSCADVQYGTILFEQTLIQSRTPFDILFDTQIDRLARFKVLVLADQECMADTQLDRIRAFVEAGGGLVVTGRTSLYNEWRRRRNSLGVRAFFKENLPYPPGIKVSQSPWAIDSRWYRHGSLIQELQGFDDARRGPVRATCGKGRVVYIPHVKPSLAKPATAPPTSRYWKLPANHAELSEAIRWVARGPLSLEIDAPPSVAAERTWQENERRMLIHLVNYAGIAQPEVKDVRIRFTPIDRRKVKEIRVLSPDVATEARTLPFEVEPDGRVRCTVPRLEVYDLVAVQYDS